ncbi:MAG: 30S ribosomal protein S7, partial [Planctomycetes bacterium]|nr:30S ribosomal protein S7 [Planctomycetota bacterium]
MPRKGPVPKRTINPDPKFNDRVLAKFMNVVMRDGKKSLAEQIVYGALDVVEQKSGEEPLKLFRKALDNLKPNVEVKARRVGGATYQVPVEVRADRRTSLAMRWLIEVSEARNENTMVMRLANELLDAANLRGNAVKKRDDTHRMAE